PDQAGSAADFWREMSGGRVSFAGSKIVGWYDLPQPFTAYEAAPVLDEAILADVLPLAAGDAQLRDYAGIQLVLNAAPNAGQTGFGYFVPKSVVINSATHEVHDYLITLLFPQVK